MRKPFSQRDLQISSRVNYNIVNIAIVKRERDPKAGIDNTHNLLDGGDGIQLVVQALGLHTDKHSSLKPGQQHFIIHKHTQTTCQSLQMSEN